MPQIADPTQAASAARPPRLRSVTRRVPAALLAAGAVLAAGNAVAASAPVGAPDQGHPIVLVQGGSQPFSCDGGLEITVTFGGAGPDDLVIDMPGAQLVLQPEAAASGMRYSNAIAAFQQHQGNSVLELGGEVRNCRAAITAADVPAEQAAFVGAWSGDDGSVLEVSGDRLTETSTQGYQTLGRVGADAYPDAGPGPNYECRIDYGEQSAKYLLQPFAEIRNAQIDQGVPNPDPLPPGLTELDANANYPVMDLLCWEAAHQYVAIGADALLRVGFGEGMIEPSVSFTRTAAAAPPPPVTPDPSVADYEATHGDWAVFCSGCFYPEEHQCDISTQDASGQNTLAFVINPGPNLGVYVPVLSEGVVEGAVWFRVDGERPIPFVPPDIHYEGMTGGLVSYGEPVDRLLPPFEAGTSVELSSPDPAYSGYRHTFSLIGFTAALDDAIANLPVDPPECTY